MIVAIIIVVLVIVVYKFSQNTRETVERVKSFGGMRTKYSKLVNNILEGHKDCQIFGETRTYLRIGVTNFGGSTMFHIQQCPGNKVMIDYDVSGNPVLGSFSLRFTFDDTMDQDEMMKEIALGVQRRLM